MMNRLIRNLSISTLFALTVVGLGVTPTMALYNASAKSTDRPLGETNAPKSETDEHAQGSQTACEARIQGITKRSGQLVARATMQLGIFDNHLERLTDFYTKNFTSQGKEIPGFDALNTAAEAARQTVQTSLAQAQVSSSAISCETTSPKIAVQTFRIQMQTVVQSLQAYKTSVKNIVVLVKTATESLDKVSTDE